MTTNEFYNKTDSENTNVSHKLHFLREYINTLIFSPYQILGNKLLLIIKSTIIFSFLFVVDIIMDYVIDKSVSWKSFLFMFLSYFMYLFSSYIYTKASDLGAINILIYNMNSSIFLIPLYAFYRIFNLFIINPFANVLVLNIIFILFYITSFVSLSINISFYDYTMELFSKITVLRLINQAIISNLIFFGLFIK